MKTSIFSFFVLLIFCYSFRSPIAGEPDKAFLIKASQSNLAEIGAAQIALAQSSADSVKAYAQMMIDEHTKAQTDLSALAQKQNVTLPDSTDTEHRLFSQRLKLLQGTSFDSVYVQSQVRDHVKTIALFKAETAQGKNDEDKAFAKKLLPNLQTHLNHAYSLQGMKPGNMNM